MSQLLQQKAEQMSADPLKGHAYYEKLKDLNKGSYGFVQVWDFPLCFKVCQCTHTDSPHNRFAKHSAHLSAVWIGCLFRLSHVGFWSRAYCSCSCLADKCLADKCLARLQTCIDTVSMQNLSEPWANVSQHWTTKRGYHVCWTFNTACSWQETRRPESLWQSNS